MNAPVAFRVAARTILELGAELISSDGIALYELLKNAIDAQSPQVRININVSLRHTPYMTVIDAIDGQIGLQDAFEGEETEQRRMEAESIRLLKSQVFAALEADTTEDCRKMCADMIEPRRTLSTLRRAVERFYDRANWIDVEDTGEGMSLNDLQHIYLTIGTRSRQQVKADPSTNPSGRVYLGEKGVGRLSAMRLGGILSVRTTKAGEERLHRLDVDWDWFSHDSDKLLGEIKISPRDWQAKPDPATSGTLVKIMRLRSDWSSEKFARIVLDEFSRLIDPFESRAAGRLLRLTYNGKRHHIPEIERSLFEIAHAECKAQFRYEDGAPVLRGYVNYRLRGRERTFVLREPELRGAIGEHPWSAVTTLGPFDVELWWYNRRALTDIAGIGKKADLQARVRRWSGGLMLFRDGFRINPYGGADDDWLALDKRAFSARGFKLNRQQVIGRVVITWRNDRLIEQTNREGLTDTPEKLVLVDLLQSILFKQFKSFLDACDDEVRVQEVTTLEDLQAKVERAQDDISRRIREIIVRVPAEQRALGEVDRLVRTLNGYIDQARELSQEYESDRSKFTYLAGIGLMVEFILHELGRATNHTLKTLRDAESAVKHGSTVALLPSFRNLDDQLTTIVKRVETLDPLSTSRRQRKEKFDVFEVVRQVVEGRADQARRHGVSVEGNFDGRGFIVDAVRGMFIQILENLLANSFYWLSVQREIEPGMRSYIEIDIDPTEKTVTVTDNGPGVEPIAAETIFNAFESHRPARDGKGLGLYISRELASYHDWTIEMLRESTVRKGRYNAFVLDLSASTI